MAPNRDKSVLYPRFAERLTDFESRLAAAKLGFFLFEGLRTFDQQADYYAIGRTKPGQPCRHGREPIARLLGTCPEHRLGAIITRARPGLSFHQYGTAADYVADGMPEKPGLQWSWNMKIDVDRDGRPDWMQMGELAEVCGLEWAGRWETFVEFPHVQLSWGLTARRCLEIYQHSGVRLQAVWEEFDKTA